MKNLKAVRLRSAINFDKKKLEERKAEFEELEKRNDQLAKAIEEAETEEDQKIVDEQIEEFDKDKKATETEIADLEKKIEESEEELKEIEEVNKDPLVAERDDNKKIEIRKKEGNFKMEMNKRFKDLSMQERTAFVERDGVKDFINQVRTGLKGEKVIVPTEFMGLFYKELPYASKCLSDVDFEQSNAKGRLVIVAEEPTLVWTESTDPIKESGLTFEGMEINDFKAACFVAIHNSILEDNDVDLASKLLSLMVKASAKAYDEAILVGDGVKKPTGITKTEGIIKTTAKGSGLELFKSIMTGTADVKGDGVMTWYANHKTIVGLRAESAGINANAMIAFGMNNELPLVGGKIKEVECLEDGKIVGGYMKKFKFVERKSATIAQSEHVRFLDDQTVFRMVERADGKVVLPTAFAEITLPGAKSGK